MSLNVAEGEELCHLSDISGKKLMVGFTFLFNNGLKQLKELNVSGRLGKVYYLTSKRTHMGPVRQDVNVVWDLASHDIAIINFILDSAPVAVLATGAKSLGTDHYDVAFITLYYPNGIIGQIHISWIDSNKERIVRIIGSKARAEFNDLNNLEPIRVFEKGISIADHIEADFGNFRFLLRDGNIISPKIDMSEPLRQMIDTFICAVLDKKEIVPDGHFSFEVTKTIVAIQKSLASKSIQMVTG
jgi:predicted dehydrogenase